MRMCDCTSECLNIHIEWWRSRSCMIYIAICCTPQSEKCVEWLLMFTAKINYVWAACSVNSEVVKFWQFQKQVQNHNKRWCWWCGRILWTVFLYILTNSFLVNVSNYNQCFPLKMNDFITQPLYNAIAPRWSHANANQNIKISKYECDNDVKEQLRDCFRVN